LYGSLVEPDGIDVRSWFTPFDFEMHTDVCEPDPFEPPENDSAGFIRIPCPAQHERAAFMVRSPWAIGFVYDGTTAPFGDYRVHTQVASTTFPEGGEAECPDAPHSTGRLILYRPG
ncbi:MAG TPA: hypothetical protein VFG69_18885, partial [Nannocystaceae bacterium]|nr:hypothetical protein [Nannocystaceae bacterium]